MCIPRERMGFLVCFLVAPIVLMQQLVIMTPRDS